MRKLLSSLSLALLWATFAFAQERTVTGTVTAKDDGEALPGVSIRVKGATTGTQTGVNGQYSISVPQNAVLVFSYIGFATQEISVGVRSVIDVTLGTDATQLSEVVVTALGLERQKKDIGYATATISNEALTQANAVNVVNGLQGKVSGLNVTSISSGVTEDVVITMRGLRSLTGNNDPLLVLDGVPTQLSYLSSINPNDIANVSVLKGSSSAGIYGSDARNGVIVVTTKKSADKPVITFSNSTQLSNISFFPKMQTQFGSGGYGEYIPYENWSWGPAYDGSSKEIGETLPDGSVQTVKYSATDQRKEFFNTGATIQNDLSFSANNFYLSFQDANIKGVVPDDENRRTGIRLNAGREYGRFKANLGINYIQNNYSLFNDDGMSDFFTAQGSGGNDGLMSQIFNTPAHIPLSNYKNFNSDPFSSYNNYYNRYGLNPYFAIDNWRNDGKRQDILANIQLELKAADWLNFTYRPAFSARTIAERFYSRGEAINQFGDDRDFNTIPGVANERSYNSTRLSSDLFGQLNKEINGNFNVGAILGTYVSQIASRDSRVGASSLVVPEVFNVANRTGNLSGSSPESKVREFAVYGSANVGYKGWANIEFTGRNEWTSVLAIGNNSFFYPGVNASFVATDAIEALKGNNILSYLKLRAAWTKTGNADIDPYQLAAVFTQPNVDGKFYTGFPYGPLAGYSAGNTTFDANLKPEFTNSMEFGAESSFFNGRVNLEGTYFHQKNTNQIINVRVSDATGYNFANLNAASFINKGFELDMRLTPLVKFRDGNVQFRANATYNDSEVTSIYSGLDQLSIGGYLSSGNAAIVGRPAFVIKATDYKRDDEGRIIVDRLSGYPSQDPNTKEFGRTLPLWIVGLNPSVNWKGFNLSALAEYKGGHQVSFYAMGGDMAWTGTSAATARNNRERFVIPNSSYEDPNNPGTYIANTNVTVSNVNDFYTGVYQDVASNFITSAAAWRLRELALSFDIPAKFLARQKVVKGASLALTGRNLFVWVPKTNEFTDPDFNSVREDYPNTFGIVNSQSNPPVRIYGANLVVRF
ncbi:SusC/RagA family TonB-linked outer membrane protein [Paradesertivirga mongoliensis]|uniref:SusC/RagA family TonB-linked outer membrane protein n=1 Tax=Paradesertivirga mongoliensis TaxID=2100740 RepID=A0ABW4ZJJ0_9SPHI|nr:SusC/RagA family TonB-linked outer membrane protein [Pedobacter mongoliensis]